MLFIETEIFTEDVQKLLTDDEFSRFQFFLALNPDYGEVIPETGGLRKVRWVSGGKGKRAGVRVIYFHQVKHYEIRLLLIYRKGIKDDLSPQEKAMLRMAQMNEIIEGTRQPSRTFEVDAMKIKEIRRASGLSQSKFADLISVSVDTLRNWEQGRRSPTGPAKALLRAIANDPQHVLQALNR